MHPRSAILARGVYAEIILQHSDSRPLSAHDESPEWNVVKAVHARRDGYDPHRIPHNIVLEVKVLHKVAHDNIVELLEYDFDPETSLHRISLPLLAFTLAELVATVSAQDAGVIARSVAYQASSALTYLHERGIAHRDVNPKNIMFDWDGILKLVDFSTAFAPRVYHTGEEADEMVCQVGTGSYRAPELLFGSYSYDAPALDLWGLGVCLADIFRGLGPLFDASFGDIGLSASIFRIRGHPSLSWPSFNSMPDADKVTFEPSEPQPLADHLPRLTQSAPDREEAVGLLDGLLRLDPSRRITAKDALRHPWLHAPVLLPADYQVRSGDTPGTRLEDGRTLVDLLRPDMQAAEARLDGLFENDLD